MAYNKAKEERKWRLWKEAEERQLRQLGVDENTIKQLRTYDWALFNSDRRYYQKVQSAAAYLDRITDHNWKIEINTVGDILDDIENEQLYRSLENMDKLTLQIVLLKMQGHSVKEIAKILQLTPKSIYRRIDRFREKIKKFYK